MSVPNNDLPGIDDLMATIRGIKDGSLTEDDLPPEDDDLTDPPQDDDQTPPADDDQDDDQPEDDADEDLDDQDEPPANDEPPTQTPEERKRFAAERRQREMQERVDAEVQRKLQEQLQQSPEIQLANQLSEIYGIPPEQMLAQLREQRLQQEAERQQVPVEVLREQERLRTENQQTQQQLVRMQFDMWNQRTDQEGQAIIKQYPGLTQADIAQAKSYMLDVLRNPNVPLQQAVMALHGDKIMKSMSNQAENEALAKVSGRKPSPLPPQGGKPSPTTGLTEEERYIAKQLKMSEEDYLKYKE